MPGSASFSFFSCPVTPGHVGFLSLQYKINLVIYAWELDLELSIVDSRDSSNGLRFVLARRVCALTGDYMTVVFFALSAVATPDKREDANSLPGKRGKSAPVLERPASALGKHGPPRHRRRQLTPHPWSHLDHHFALPGS